MKPVKPFSPFTTPTKSGCVSTFARLTPLSEAVKSALAEKIQAALGAQEVILREAVQPSLIGGFVVEVGTRVADLSVRGQLQEIQKNLLSN
jgi:F-type H+-transporting ATPase subunit delta